MIASEPTPRSARSATITSAWRTSGGTVRHNRPGFSSVGLGYVNYYNPNTGMLELLGMSDQISIIDNTAATDDLVLGLSLSNVDDNPQFIELADGLGEIHDHVVFDLLNDATMPLGAYGILFQLQTDLNPLDGIIDFTSEAAPAE